MSAAQHPPPAPDGERGLTAERLAANLCAAIKAAGLTQREVAERVDMDPTALSKALSGKRHVSSLELALICTATGSDVFGILEAEPLHGPSYRAGMREAEARVGIISPDYDGDYTGCGVSNGGGTKHEYCDLPADHGGPHHAHHYWAEPAARPARTEDDLRARLTAEDVRSLVAKRLLKVASPEGLWGHLTPLERERFTNHAETLLTAVTALLDDTATRPGHRQTEVEG